MTSITVRSERVKLLKTVEREFRRSGWQIARLPEESRDFRMTCRNLCLLVKCVDETRIEYESVSSLVAKLEGFAREVRTLPNRQLVVVLNRSFISVPLESLIDRGIFAVVVEDLAVVTGLSAVSDRIPLLLDSRQTYLLERSLEHAIFLSKLYQDQGAYKDAIKWGKCAVEHSVGYTHAYLHLFWLLKATGDLEAAAELGKEMFRYRPDDPQVLRGLEDLARKRGDEAGAAQWRTRLTEQPIRPRTLDELVAKQRAQRGLTAAPQLTTIRAERSKSAFARLLNGFRRTPR